MKITMHMYFVTLHMYYDDRYYAHIFYACYYAHVFCDPVTVHM